MARFRSGWVKLWRSILEHPSADDATSIGLMVWLMLNANRETSRCKFGGKLTEVPPGSLLTSTKEMAEKLVLDRRTLRRRLNWFEVCGSIVQRVSNHGRIISLVNWDDYQGSDEELGQPMSTQCPPGDTPAPFQRPHNGEEKKKRRERERAPKKGRPERQTTWEAGDEFSSIFDNLLAIPAYALVFDREHDRKTIRKHMDGHGLTLREMERITGDLRQYCDGLLKPIASPRGKLNTFVQSFVDRRPKNSTPQLNFKSVEDLMREGDQ